MRWAGKESKRAPRQTVLSVRL
ncbi:MAG: hypothetical protein JWM25_24, partial [Thermoleophilia bacterium]|nr:hypothetical protein [Thermoleophilia bacterium]